MLDLDGSVAVVSGAGSGIGRAMALRFAAEGLVLAVCDVEAAALEETVALLAASDPGASADARLLAEVVDVSDGPAVAAFADRVHERFGTVDLLCNNAGVFVGGVLWDRPIEDFDFSLGVNLYGILHAVRAFVARMVERGTEAHVVNTVSVAGLLGTPFAGPYSVSKFAAFAATESLASDLLASGSAVRAHALCPGPIRTRIAESDRNRPDSLATERTDDRAFVEDMLAATVADAMAPDEVAGIVLDAIARPAASASDQFLILTHPAFAEQVLDRAAALARGELPPPSHFGN